MTWTAARPTKPGKYWLSIGIDHREKFASDVCREPHHVYLLDIFEEGGGLWLDGVVEVGHCLPASALFNRYVEPADPHAQPVDRDAIPETRAYRMSNDPKTPNLRLILSVEPGEVVLYEADMTSRSATAKETAVHDKVIMSPADARWLRDALQQADLSDPPEVTSAEPVPSLREQVEGLTVWPTSSGAQYIDRSEVLALLDEVTR